MIWWSDVLPPLKVSARNCSLPGNDKDFFKGKSKGMFGPNRNHIARSKDERQAEARVCFGPGSFYGPRATKEEG